MPEETKEMTKAEAKKILASLEDEIRKISEFGRAFLDSNLAERTILLLIRDTTGVCLTDIRRVLCAAAKLDKTYLKK